MAEKQVAGGPSSAARGSGDDYDIAAPRNIFAMIVVAAVAFVMSRSHGGMYLYAGLGSVALMKPGLTAVVGLALCVIDVADPRAVFVVLGTAYTCRHVLTHVDAGGMREAGLSIDDLTAFHDALEFRSGNWFLACDRLSAGYVTRFREASLIYPKPVRHLRGGTPDGSELLQLSRRGTRLAWQKGLTSDDPSSDRLWNRSSGSSTPVYVVSILAVFVLLLGWRSVPGTIEAGRVAASLGQDLDAEVSADEFATAALTISGAADARALFRPLACRLFLASDDDLAIRMLQSLLLTDSSFTDFEEECERTPRRVDAFDAGFDLVYTESSRSKDVIDQALPLLDRMSGGARLVGGLRIAACLNDASGDRLTAASQMTFAKALQAKKRIPTSQDLEEICPAPTSGYTETGAGVDIIVLAIDHEARTERTFK